MGGALAIAVGRLSLQRGGMCAPTDGTLARESRGFWVFTLERCCTQPLLGDCLHMRRVYKHFV
jgi:hypothetical protein